MESSYYGNSSEDCAELFKGMGESTLIFEGANKNILFH